ncbi:MAG: right-handed parallel beta-helix repeat-containing protein [Candidatus Thermoplasmatota archaeon]
MLKGFVAFCIVGIFIFSLIQLTGQTNPPASGDWVVSDNTTITNQAITLTGNLIVTSTGVLTLDNVTLTMSITANGQYGIEIQAGGKFYLKNSTLTSSSSSYRYTFKIRSGATAEIINTNIDYCGFSGSAEQQGIYIQSNNVLISNSVIKNGYSSIYVQSSSPKIASNTIRNNAYCGIYVYSNSNPIITNNIISHNSQTNIYSYSSSPQILNNSITNSQYGIQIYYSNSLIKNNTISSNNYGMYGYEDSLDILNNNISSNTNYGICVYNWGGQMLMVANNTISGVGSSYDIYYYGGPITIINNTIKNGQYGIHFAWQANGDIKYNSISQVTYGLYLYSSTATLISNTITQTTNGCYFYYNSQGTSINNTISGSTSGIMLSQTSTAIAINTTFGTAKVMDAQSTLSVYWYLGANVFWENGSIPVPGASIKVKNKADSEVGKGTTDNEGKIRDISVQEYVLQGTTKTSYTPHKVFATKDGKTNSTSVDLTENKIVDVILDDVPPILFIDSPKEGTVVNTDRIQVKGRTEPDAAVFVNGYPASVDYIGRFSINIGSDEGFIEGENILEVEAVDRAGNSNTTLIRVIKDKIPPQLNVYSPSNGSYTNASIILVAGKTEVGANVSVNGENVLVDELGKFNVSVSIEEGENTIVVSAKDFAGNVVVVNIVVIRDSVPPSLTLITPLDGTLTTEKEITINGYVETGVDVTVNGKKIQVIGQQFLTTYTLKEDENIIIVSATDKAKNSNTIVRKVVLDTIAPELSIIYPPSALITNMKNIFVSGTVSEKCTVTVNEEVIEVIDGKFNVSVSLEEGKNEFTIIAKDRVGHTAELSIDVTLDTTPPKLSITEPGNNFYTSGNEVEIKGKCDGDVYINDTKVETDQNGYFSYKYKLVEGENIINITGIDTSGNIQRIKRIVIRDTIPPELIIIFPNTTLYKTKDRGIEIKGKSEPYSSIYINEIKIIAPSDGLFTFYVPLTNETNTIVIRVVDNLNNTNTSIISVIKVEKKITQQKKDDSTLWLIGVALIAIFAFITTVYIYRRKETLAYYPQYPQYIPQYQPPIQPIQPPIQYQPVQPMPAQQRLLDMYHEAEMKPQHLLTPVQRTAPAYEPTYPQMQKCNYCGADVYPDSIICNYCGYQLKEEIRREIKANLCPKCNIELEKDWTICPFCETDIEISGTQVRCLGCGRNVEKTWRDCPYCATPLKF